MISRRCNIKKYSKVIEDGQGEQWLYGSGSGRQCQQDANSLVVIVVLRSYMRETVPLIVF